MFQQKETCWLAASASTKYKPPVRNLNVESVVLPFACAYVCHFMKSIFLLWVVRHCMMIYRDRKCNIFLIIIAAKN